MRLCLTAILLISAAACCAQDTTRARVDRWYVPDEGVLQYAGSIGFLSAGVGYQVFRQRAHVDIIFGYVPANFGGAPLETITLKFTAAPWHWRAQKRLSITPLTTGVYFCYTPGRQFSSDLPSWYPSGYYWWSEAIRANLIIGGSLNLSLPRGEHFRRVDLYYELGTNEIKLASYVQNTGSLHLHQILHAGIGLRLHIVK